jgi:anti-sigma factor RsiW
MTHPVELLVGLEDGTLADAERAVLEAHLAGCARCRAEVASATAARDALRALPQPTMPPGLLDGVREEAERTAAERSGGAVTPLGGGARAARWQKAIAALGAAAAVLLIGGLILPKLGGADTTRIAASEDAGGANGAQAPTALEGTRATAVDVSDTDYDAVSAGELAQDVASGGSTQGVFATAGPDGASAPAQEADTASLDAATACLRTAFGSLPGDPIRLIRARYERDPAYLGIFLIGPGADQPATTAKVLIADADSCATLGSAEARIGG